MSEERELPCGSSADARYCPVFWDLTTEVERLQAVIRELLDSTGLDDDEQARWLDMAGIPADGDEAETEAILADPETMAAIAEGMSDAAGDPR